MPIVPLAAAVIIVLTGSSWLFFNGKPNQERVEEPTVGAPSINYLGPTASTTNLYVSSIPSKDCIGTDSAGKLQSGTCTGSGSGLATTSIDTEADLESILTDVTNVFTNNDGALNDDDLTNNSIEDLSDVASFTQTAGDFLFYNGSAWDRIAPSSLRFASSTLLSDSNTWSALNQFTNASTTLFSCSGTCYFGGANESTFFSDGRLLVDSAGTGADPAISVGSAGGPGIYAGGSTELSLSNGSQSISWDGTRLYPNTNNVRNLGIANTNVWANAYITSIFSTNASTTNATSSVSHYLPYLATAAGTFIAADPNGLLIATSTPSSGSASTTLLSDNNTWSGQNTFALASTSNATTSVSHYFPSGGIWNSSGRIGIGTTAPSALIHAVENTTSEVGVRIENLSNSAGGDALLSFYNPGRPTAGLTISLTRSPYQGLINAPSGDELILQSGSGKVGIGTTTPGSKLSVTSGVSIGANYGVAAPTNGAIIQGSVGIGTTSPGTILSVQGVGNFHTATSTFTSTGGIQLSGGCFAMPNGACLGAGGSGTVTQIDTTYPILGGPITTTGTISSAWATTSQPASSNLFVSNGAAGFYGVATSSATINSPLSGSLIVVGTGQSLSIADAAADGSTKGAASFTAADFNSSSGNISIDYANGQEASGSQDGFLSSSNWTTFNNKLTALGSGWATTTGANITFSTSTASFNGLTFGQTIAPSASSLLFTPTITGTLDNTGLTNSSVSYGGVSVSLGGSDATPAFNLADATGLLKSGIANSGTLSFDWSNDEVADDLTISGGTINNSTIGATTPSSAVFTSASSTNATSSVSHYFPFLATGAGTFVAIDPAGKLIATSTPTSGSASTTLLSDSNTWSGLNVFGNATSTLFTATTAWLTNLFIGADTIAEYIADTAGAMFTGNTETGITVTYQDADNTVDFVVANLEDLAGTLDVASGGTGATALDDILGTANQISVANGADTIIGGDATLSLPSHVIFPSSYQAASGSTTAATSSTFAITSITSALPLAAADGSIQEYAGTSCTNQFVRSLNGAGVATCASVSTTDITDDTILEVDLDATNAAGDNQILSFDLATGGFTWVDDADSGAGTGSNWKFLDLMTIAPTTTTAGIGVQADFFTGTSTSATSTFSLLRVNDPTAASVVRTAGTFTGNRFQFGGAVYPANYVPSCPDCTYVSIDRTTTGDDASLIFREQGNARAEIGLIGDAGAQNFTIKKATGTFPTESWSTVVTITPERNVGIGSTTPTTLLSVGTNSAFTVDYSGNASTTGTIDINGTFNGATNNAVLSLMGNEASGQGAYLRVRDNVLGTVGYYGQNSVINGGTAYSQLSIQNPQATGSICLSAGGRASATAGTNCDLLIAATTGTTTATSFSVTNAVSILGEYFTNFTTYVRSLFTGGRSITVANGQFDADAELYTDSWTFQFASSTTVLANTSVPVAAKKVPQAATISTITCANIGTGTSTIMFEERTAINTAGTDVLYSAGLSAGGDLQQASSTLPNSGMASGNWLVMLIDAVSAGSPKNPVCDVKFTYDD